MPVREARLFVAGNYKDKGVDISDTDLDDVVSRFSPCPIRIEHDESLFDGVLGHVVSIYRKGVELWGKIDFPRDVWSMCDRVKSLGRQLSLSVGLSKVPYRIVEVSLVTSPRVLTAQVFGDTLTEADGLLVFSSNFGSESVGGVIKMPDVDIKVLLEREREVGKAEGRAEAETQFDARIGPAERELARLRREKSEESAAAKIAGFKAEGKLCPAAEKFAMAILVDGAAEVTFSDGGHMPVAEAFVQFMTFQAPIVQTVGGSTADKDSDATEVEKAIFSKLGVTEEEVKAVDGGGA